MITSDTDYTLLYQVNQLPILQNRVYVNETEAKACSLGDVKLVQGRQTGLIFNQAFNSDSIVYDSNYQNEQALSPFFQSHLEMVVSILQRTMPNMPLVELGCGKGFFLELLLSKGFNIIGYDPAYEGDNPRVIKEYFTGEPQLNSSGLVLRHVLEHIQNPVGFLRSLAYTKASFSRIYIEVPCFNWILNHKAWFDIFYEHVNYFRLSDFYRIFETIHEAGHLFGGQYIYVVAELDSVRQPLISDSDEVYLPADFTSSTFKPINCGNPAAVWGGGSKGVIFSLLMQRKGLPIEMVIDINPAKQGKYLPATGLPVLSPQESLIKLPSGSTMYVMNSNYLDEIRIASKNKYRYVGVDYE